MTGASRIVANSLITHFMYNIVNDFFYADLK